MYRFEQSVDLPRMNGMIFRKWCERDGFSNSKAIKNEDTGRVKVSSNGGVAKYVDTTVECIN